MQRLRTDAIVIGARCAGAAAAMLMARGGMQVLCIDRSRYGADTVSTHALMRGAVLQLHRWGLLPRLVELATPAIRSTSFHYGDEPPVTIPIRPGDGVDALYAPRRTLLDSLLADAAVEAGVDLRHGHALVALLHDDVTGRVAGAIIIGPEGQPLHVEAPLVVGADGIASAVARLAEAPVLHAGTAATAVVYGYWSGLPPEEGFHWHYVPGAGVGAIPTNAGQHCVFAAMRPERLRSAGGPSLLHTVLQEAAPGLAARIAAACQESRVIAFAGRRGFMRQPYGPGWALVGDAGYFKDPLTAHGITDALRDAELLADAALTGTDTAMETYAAVRESLSRPLWEATEAIARLDWTLDELKLHHQALNAAMKREVAFMATRPSAALRRIAEAQS